MNRIAIGIVTTLCVVQGAAVAMAAPRAQFPDPARLQPPPASAAPNISGNIHSSLPAAASESPQDQESGSSSYDGTNNQESETDGGAAMTSPLGPGGGHLAVWVGVVGALALVGIACAAFFIARVKSSQEG